MIGEKIMAVERWAMIENGYVINICLWDGDVTRWKPPGNIEMQLAPDFIDIGWKYENENWEAPQPQEATQITPNTEI
jgi:hypothetical protein